MAEANKEIRVVVVTGGARGIGLGIARCFARQGDCVVVADLRLEDAEAMAADLKRSHGAADAYAVRCDVTDPASVEALADEVFRRSARVDVLVNNAGVCHFTDVLALSLEQWHQTIAVNLTGPFLCTRAISRRMIESGRGGRILFITSLAENFTSGAQADYAASKGGLRMLMRGFASALGPKGITCNAVAPGIILTDLTRRALDQPAIRQRFEKAIPVGRLGNPEDIGRACVLLASGDADYVNGTTLVVDGGFTVDTRS